MPLLGGRVMGNSITCPFHGAIFDLRTGRAQGSPAIHPIKIYRIRVRDMNVEIEIDE
jgi:3-phenylpropionate/trans-cinnamate dioxygenase ferredoxin subunit